MSAKAAWGQNEWVSMEEYTTRLPRETQDGAFNRAVLAVHKEKWGEAQEYIDLTRDLYDAEVTALSLESYQRAYPAMVTLQMLAELEEVIEFKLMKERQEMIKEMWWQRLQGCHYAVEDWQKIMHVRSLVITPQSDQRTWLKYASLCRNSGRLQLSKKTLGQILGIDPNANLDKPLPTEHPQAAFSFCKHLWAADKKDTAYGQLKVLVKRFLHPRVVQLKHIVASQPVPLDNAPDHFNNRNNFEPDEPIPPTEEEVQLKELRNLLARSFHTLGNWQSNLKGANVDSIESILSYYRAATENDPTWAKAWHHYAVWNFEAVQLFAARKSSTCSSPENQQRKSLMDNYPPVSREVLLNHIVPAVNGFAKSISLTTSTKGSTLQDTLRMLTILFEYGDATEVYEALHDGMRTIAIDNWLQVVPQLIARIDTPRNLVARLINDLLTDMGKYHPQAVLYSLTLAAKSTHPARQAAANKVLNRIREHSDRLVTQALMISDELIRVAILWHEMWHEGLEEASRLYFGERNVHGMLNVLKPLHALLDRGAQTLKETSFVQAYGSDLSEARKWTERYENSNSNRDLNQAWDLYYHVFRRISRQLPKLTQLELQYVSPRLLGCKDLDIAVPGSYAPKKKLICISRVYSSLQVRLLTL